MAVKSPCIDVCVFKGKSGFCVGCLRTASEAQEWKKLTGHRRHQIINDRARREQKLQLETKTGMPKEKHE